MRHLGSARRGDREVGLRHAVQGDAAEERLGEAAEVPEAGVCREEG